MSSTPVSPDDVTLYLNGLGLNPDERADYDRCATLTDVHRKLADGGGREAPAWASQDARLKLKMRAVQADGWAEGLLMRDKRGYLRLQTMPPMRRACMAARPWQGNPLVRMGRWLGAHWLGRRGRMQSRAAVPESDAPLGRSPWRWTAVWRRSLLTLLATVQTVVASYYMTAVLPYHGRHELEIAILIVYAILFAWVSAGFWTAVMGFWLLLLGRDRYSISATAAADAPLPADVRTAVLIPICNEDVARVYAGLRATYTSVQRAGLGDRFDFYILSDSSDADTRVAELEGWLELLRQTHGHGRIHYRRRRHRIKRKSGNIADWCRRWGSLYRYMVIMDADSVMSGASLKRLMQLMEANPGAGIIQTAPRASGRDTLYARIQQFAHRAYGPLFTAGLHFWQLGESHYWGHNAIIRVAPFIRHCALGRLPGHGALAGEIVSHDFVEAALMRRAGWSVWIAYDLPGSYEEMPPTLLDELRRDRRWCQGNLQNFRLFWTQGLHPAHRAVFMTGVMAYLSAPLWFLFLALATALLAMQTLVEPQYFTEPYQLFPVWPEWHPEWAKALFGVTASLLFLPKALAVLLILVQGARRYGGSLRLLMSASMEWIFSALLAPVRMLFHTHFVLTSLVGVAVRRRRPPRGDIETSWKEALRRHGFGTVLGTAWVAGVYWLNPSFLWWLLPIVGSLMVSIPLSVYSSRRSPGHAFRLARLFLIPEEGHPPQELRWTWAGVKRHAVRPQGVARAVLEPLANALMCATVTPRLRMSPGAEQRRRLWMDGVVTGGPYALPSAEVGALLSDAVALSRLHFRLWTETDGDPVWAELKSRVRP